MTTHSTDHDQKLQAGLILAAIGVVFGDIGTSPLYALKEVFHGHDIPIDQSHVLGVLSLIFWSLTLVVTIKYAIFIMRADNKGEGGIMALMTLAMHGSRDNPERMKIILTLGLLGATLFYGDSIIIPAISVLSAVEGLQVVAPNLDSFILPIALAVLSVLFIIQARGTGAVGKIFAPVMCLWLGVLAVMGIINILHNPAVLMAIDPYHAVHVLWDLGWRGLLIMGSVVLAITGAEALYADMGHFGLKPIRFAWLGFVFPALLLNYFGQGVLLIANPEAIQNPFYLLAPGWALYPLLILSTLATVIASQAVISGAFSVTRQAIQLGYCPRMDIFHTSGDEMGQVYVPAVNWMLMFSVFILVLSFKSSSALASAYGIAVTGTMIIDTILAFIVIRKLWQWKTATSILFLIGFLMIDVLFFVANSVKIPTGGWLPLAVATVIFLIITTWIKGREMLLAHQDDRRVLFEELEAEMKDNPPVTVKGTAIYLTRSLHGVPLVFMHNLEHNHVLHEKTIVLTIVTKDEPYVDEAHRVKVRSYGENKQFYRVKFYFGFQQQQDVRRALELCARELQEQYHINLDIKHVSFFVGREFITFKRRSEMPAWRRPISKFLFHNSSSAIEFFQIPVERVIEIGVRVEL
ncbi:MAG: potassium transporter Kup [Gammaproteobacteria bacterium]|nr:potassium transporter Kup [Gammaproteobacteria bacterium]